GKGGVGKTTCAAALALVAARGSRAVRLLSVDPAHSLADALRVPLDDRWRRLGEATDLRARELDADRVWARWRTRLDDALALDASAHQAFADLVGTPEGFAELAAAFDLARALDHEPDALFIVDCPPTGHALRLLAAPDAAVAWIHTALAT